MDPSDAQQRVRRLVEERRAAGDYPPDMEGALEALGDQGQPPGAGGATALKAALRKVSESSRFDARTIPSTSRTRAGSAAHRLIAAAVARQTSGVLAQVRDFATQVSAALIAIAERLDQPGAHNHPLLEAQIDAAVDRLALLDRPQGAAMAGLADLSARIGGIEEILSPSDDGVPYPSLDSWWEQTAGPRSDMVALRAALATGLSGPVLDVACGAGEMLEALAAAGIEARGAELDSFLRGRAAGAGRLPVEPLGPFGVLGNTPDAGLGSIVALGVPERLTPAAAAQFMGLAAIKLRAGGRLVVESVDPAGPSPWADPRTRRPQAPEWLAFACRHAGFSSVEVTRAAQQPPGVREGHYLLVATR